MALDRASGDRIRLGEVQRVEFVEDQDKRSVPLDLLIAEGENAGLTLIFVQDQAYCRYPRQPPHDIQLPLHLDPETAISSKRGQALATFRSGRPPIIVVVLTTPTTLKSSTTICPPTSTTKATASVVPLVKRAADPQSRALPPPLNLDLQRRPGPASPPPSTDRQSYSTAQPPNHNPLSPRSLPIPSIAPTSRCPLPTAPFLALSSQRSLPRRLVISAFMIASKVTCDGIYPNKSWCVVVGQGTFLFREINQMEREMCSHLEWVLNVQPEELAEFETEVKRDYGTGGLKTGVAPSPVTPTTTTTSPTAPVSTPAQPVSVRSAVPVQPATRANISYNAIGTPESLPPSPSHSDSSSPASSELRTPPTPDVPSNVARTAVPTSPGGMFRSQGWSSADDEVHRPICASQSRRSIFPATARCWPLQALRSGRIFVFICKSYPNNRQSFALVSSSES
ncbi:hypothetical protein FRC00_001267 [Tulasnella sp. 408]|nr:hypothetical protein FRC00_001267 [Tulasnella sp. 408]